MLWGGRRGRGEGTGTQVDALMYHSWPSEGRRERNSWGMAKEEVELMDADADSVMTI